MRFIAPLSLVLLLLTGCAPENAIKTRFTPSQAQADAQSIVHGLQANAKGLAALNPDPAVLAKYNAAVVAVSALPSQLSRQELATNTVAAQGAVSALAGSLDAIFGTAGVLVGVNIPAPLNNVKGAAYTLMRVMQADLGMAETVVPPPLPAGVLAWTPDQARQTLANGG